jgi:hypothetical protein
MLRSKQGEILITTNTTFTLHKPSFIGVALDKMLRTIVFLCLIFLMANATSSEDRYSSVQEVTALGKEVELSNKAAVKKLFNTRADGAVAEEVDIILGKLTRTNPKLFLEGLSQSWRANCDSCLHGLVGNTGDKLVERFEDQLKELKARRRALLGVNTQELKPLRDKCLRALDDDIREVRKAIQFESTKIR